MTALAVPQPVTVAPPLDVDRLRAIAADRRHPALCRHCRMVDDWRIAYHAWWLEYERVTHCDPAPEVGQEYRAAHPPPTFHRWLIDLRQQHAHDPREDHHMSTDLPALPYAGTSGWSGSDASRDATVDQDRDGRTAGQQRAALGLLRHVDWHGATWRDLDLLLEKGHGTCSRVLSVLHQRGMVARLVERRGNCSVYVLPEHVRGRDTAAHGRRREDPRLQAVRDLHRRKLTHHWPVCSAGCIEWPCDTIRALDET